MADFDELARQIEALGRQVREAAAAAPAADQGRTATITVQVRGTVPAGNGTEVNQRVEQALSEVARGAGLSVVAGSTRVQL